jgi:hypothetical protein
MTFESIVLSLVLWLSVLVALGFWSHKNGHYRGWTFVAHPHFCHALPWAFLAVTFGAHGVTHSIESGSVGPLFFVLFALWQLSVAIRLVLAWLRKESYEI